MHKIGKARRILLPRFVLTEVSDETDPAGIHASDAVMHYFYRPKLVPDEGKRRDGKPTWMKHQFNIFPVVLDSTGAPWAEAMIYVLARLENSANPSMSTLASIADDLTAYRRYLDEYDIDWTVFPRNKLERPTYRFNGHLKFSIGAGEVAPATAKRRMGNVVAFYRSLIYDEKVFTPSNPPWIEKDSFVDFLDAQGFRHAKKIKSTNLAIKTPVQDDPYDGTIEDGARLRPLSRHEQETLLDVLAGLGNTQMTLIHLFALLSGARIQTILTLRIKDLFMPLPRDSNAEGRIPVGYGTGIDTKFDKRMTLHLPAWFFEKLKIYAASPEGISRRLRAVGGDCPNQYLFLSRRGMPLYQSKSDAAFFDCENRLRHVKSGQAVRQFIIERVIPSIRAIEGFERFSYRFHDLRATAGMNWTDYQLTLVSHRKTTLHEAREFVRVRMGHDSSATTDRYLKFRERLQQVREVEELHEDYLRVLCDRMSLGQ
ncbi:site-specific integrase [Paraburkholderia caribensis]|uniref:site-specific integrase n=1 Tax=Paraburkholderia caribensis TaxID=75105 RepID=UPI00285BFC3B|nr:site-specific integrase [Paraburkholderia caribensis]MDR6382150.1 integrase [Paraburkholderia caribensis]